MDDDEQSSLPPDRLWQPTTAKWFFSVFGFSLAYAICKRRLRSVALIGAVEK